MRRRRGRRQQRPADRDALALAARESGGPPVEEVADAEESTMTASGSRPAVSRRARANQRP